jgi:hypothetical protein
MVLKPYFYFLVSATVSTLSPHASMFIVEPGFP